MPPGASVRIGKEEREEELRQLIEAWAKEKNVLRPGQTLEVTLEIKEPQLVAVRLENYQRAANVDLINLSELEFTVKTQNNFANASLITVGDVRQKTLEQILAHRGWGKKSAREISDLFRTTLGVELGWKF